MRSRTRSGSLGVRDHEVGKPDMMMQRKRRMCHVVGDSRFGGGSRVVLDLATAALAAGYEVDIVGTDPLFVEGDRGGRGAPGCQHRHPARVEPHRRSRCGRRAHGPILSPRALRPRPYPHLEGRRSRQAGGEARRCPRDRPHRPRVRLPRAVASGGRQRGRCRREGRGALVRPCRDGQPLPPRLGAVARDCVAGEDSSPFPTGSRILAHSRNSTATRSDARSVSSPARSCWSRSADWRRRRGSET